MKAQVRAYNYDFSFSRAHVGSLVKGRLWDVNYDAAHTEYVVVEEPREARAWEAADAEYTIFDRIFRSTKYIGKVLYGTEPNGAITWRTLIINRNPKAAARAAEKRFMADWIAMEEELLKGETARKTPEEV